jgi:hypothetical protein
LVALSFVIGGPKSETGGGGFDGKSTSPPSR